MRTIEDGRFVFCHAYQSLNDGEAQWVTGDIFDTDDQGRIVEHWDVIAECKRPTVSGRNLDADHGPRLCKARYQRIAAPEEGCSIDDLVTVAVDDCFDNPNQRLRTCGEWRLSRLGCKRPR